MHEVFNMHQLIAHGITVFAAFFAIMNPLANTPVFIGLTQDDDDDVKKEVALKGLIITFVIILVFALLGKVIFELFGLTLHAMRIAGGIVVFIIGYHMLSGKQSTEHGHSGGSGPVLDKAKMREQALGVAVSPLAMPILAGPGTIATAMNYCAQGGFVEPVITIVVFGLLCIITYLFFVYANRLVALLGKGLIQVVTRLMGLILAVIGTQMCITGIGGAKHILF